MRRRELERKRASNPNYDYEIETDKVIERLRDLATNDTQKMLVEFFDNKISVVIQLLFALDATLGPLGYTWEEKQWFIAGLGAGDYDAVLQSWLEKIRWDRVRPTTLIAECDERGRPISKHKKITTYGGPYQGVKRINRVDFQPYIRVMPHSEYPSGSGCICKNLQGFTDAFLMDRYGLESVSITVPFPAGSSLIEPGVTPNEDLSVTFPDMTNYAELCGESRLWGGMHFTQSVDASFELCEDNGRIAYEYAKSLLDGQPL